MIEPSSQHKETMQRIRTGFTGLLGVVLLIGLATIIVDTVRKDDAANMDIAAATNAANTDAINGAPSEPLAELGVAPPAEEDTQGSVVADLKPDPNLKKPMDRSPASGASPSR